MAKLTASDLRKRKKEDLFIYGYYINSASDLTSSVDVTQNKIDIYGEDDPITENTVNNGTLNVTVQDKASDITIQALITGQWPGATGGKRFYYETINSVCAWVNIKDSTNAEYTGALLYDGWTPTPGLPAGGAGEKATRNYSGQCSIPKEFNKPLTALSAVAATGASNWTAAITISGSASGDLLEDPSNAGVKAIKLFASETVANGGTIAEFKVAAGSLAYATSIWTISIPNSEVTAAGITLTGGTIWALVLYDPTKGIYDGSTTDYKVPHKIKLA